MTYERQMLLQRLIDAIDDAAMEHRATSQAIDDAFAAALGLSQALDRMHQPTDGRPVRYMPIFEEV